MQPVASGPYVGIFWFIQSGGSVASMIADRVPTVDGEPYGEFLTYGGHYEFWTKMASMNAEELRKRKLPDVAMWSEYEEWARGRVVLHRPTNRFIIYADQKLMKPERIELIVRQFELPPNSFNVRGDSHYVSVRQ